MTMFRTPILALTILIASPAVAQMDAPAAAPGAAKPVKTLKILAVGDIVPDQLLPAPPAQGSAAEKAELADLHQLIASASPARMEQARWDDAHEDPAIFDAVLGTGVSLKALPKTWALLSTVQNDANLTTNAAKTVFARIRPWGVDPTLPNCDAGKGKKPLGSYPSGHSTLGFSVGPMLATLIPEKAGAIMARAKDYALSREYCGVHFASDTAASQVVGTAVVQRFLTSSKATAMIADARAELRAAGLTAR